jgi:Protein of unknown function (DUF3631)
MTQNSLARLLKAFSIRPKQIRIDDKSAKGYELKPILEANARYVEADKQTSPEEVDDEIH